MCWVRFFVLASIFLYGLQEKNIYATQETATSLTRMPAELMPPIQCPDILFKRFPLTNNDMNQIWNLAYRFCMAARVLENQLGMASRPEKKEALQQSLKEVQKWADVTLLSFRIGYFVFEKLKLRDRLDELQSKETKN
ncbi:MAG: hypothetical protein BGO07_02415 [Alphaproteobacteria bacterium 40-19]|nr:MAG: hypothetical protein BGO07_02415 [Alphaproteobacteria bacterium 40-19]